jgi:hypothetical protein
MLIVDVLPGVRVTAIDGITIAAQSSRKSAQGNIFRFPEYRVMTIISDYIMRAGIR